MNVSKTIISLDKTKCKDCQYTSTCCYTNTEINRVTDKNDVDIFIVGQGAGKDEDININPSNGNRQPFFGRSGKYLRQIIKYFWDNNKLFNVAFSNNVRFHPQDSNGKDRAPEQNEIQACFQHLLDDIVITNPKVILTVGLNSFTSFFPDYSGYTMSMVRTYQREFLIQEKKFNIVATYHPSFLLRQYGTFDPMRNNQFDRRFMDDMNFALMLCV